VVLLLFMTFLGSPLSVAAAAAELPRILVVHGLGEDHPVQQGIERFREGLAGVVTVQASVQGDDAEVVRSMLAGEVDAAVVSPAALRDVAGEVTMLDLIGLWRDRDHWARALDGEPGRQLAALVERTARPRRAGLRVLGFWGGTRRHLLTRRDGVPTVEALAALRLRVPINPVRSKMWKALGVQPVLLPLADASAALRDGMVEGVEDEAEAILRERWFETAPHLTETGHAIATRMFLVAGPAWGRLTRAQQAAVTAAARDAATVARAAESNREAEALISLKDRYAVTLHGFTGHSALIGRTRAFRRRYADELGVSRLLTLIEQSANP
jgi:TRAP-type C4-dicarboxylate transport system substrate-binding protein